MDPLRETLFEVKLVAQGRLTMKCNMFADEHIIGIIKERLEEQGGREQISLLQVRTQ